jgi:hypothetical protein
MSSNLTDNTSVGDFLAYPSLDLEFDGGNFRPSQFETGQEVRPDYPRDSMPSRPSTSTIPTTEEINIGSSSASQSVLSQSSHEEIGQWPTSDWLGLPSLPNTYSDHRTNLMGRQRISHSASPSFGPTHQSSSPFSVFRDLNLNDSFNGRLRIQSPRYRQFRV